jgi:CRP/FNR family transcriptional regulator
MYLSERARKTGSLSLILSQEDIGNAIHLTKETVNRKLSILQDEGLVEVSGKKKITILDLGLLKQRAFF